MKRLQFLSILLLVSLYSISNTLTKQQEDYLLQFVKMYNIAKIDTLETLPFEGYQIATTAKNDEDFKQKIADLFTPHNATTPSFDSLTYIQQQIVWAIELWNIIYNNKEFNISNERLNSYLTATINGLRSEKAMQDPVFFNFIVWLDNPYMRLSYPLFSENPKNKKYTLPSFDRKLRINVPIQDFIIAENRCVVTALPDSVNCFLKGDIIHRVGDVDIDSLLTLYAEKGVNMPNKLTALDNILKNTYYQSSLTIEVERFGKFSRIVLSPKDNSWIKDRKVYIRGNKQFVTDNLKQKNIFYIASSLPPRNGSSIILDAVLPEINRSKALIVDFRNNSWQTDLAIILNRAINKIHVPIYAIIDGRTLVADDMEFDKLYRSNKLIFIGSTTLRPVGKEIIEIFEGGIKFRYSTTSKFKRKNGFPPNIKVEATMESIIEGRDEVLEKTVEIVLENKKGG